MIHGSGDQYVTSAVIVHVEGELFSFFPLLLPETKNVIMTSYITSHLDTHPLLTHRENTVLCPLRATPKRVYLCSELFWVVAR